MTLRNLFPPISTWSAAQLRDYLRHHGPADYRLLDVRQPAEYARGHLPGAQLLPLPELQQRLAEVDRAKTVIVYCASGIRSPSAARILAGAGYTRVHHLAGGLKAWLEPLASGRPEADLPFFGSARNAADYVVLVWFLEEGTQTFYRAVARRNVPRLAAVFTELAAGEARHQRTLQSLYEGLAGLPAPPGFPHGILTAPPAAPFMEGGIPLATALSWAENRTLADLLELSLAAEASARDRYLLLSRSLPDPDASRAFEVLADEERRHLQRLTTLFDRLQQS